MNIDISILVKIRPCYCKLLMLAPVLAAMFFNVNSGINNDIFLNAHTSTNTKISASMIKQTC